MVEVLTHRRSVTTSLWEVPKMKRQTMPTEAIEEEVTEETTTSGLTYDSPVNPNAKTTVIHDDSEDEVDEAEKEVATYSSKQTKYDPPPLKAYKLKIPYPQRLRKEKMEERYAKFIDLIKEVRINVPLVDVLADMPNYGKFLKDLVSNKSKMEQISVAFLNEECSVIVQNKLLPKVVDLRSFLIPCSVAGSVEYLSLADLGASINLMLYSLYASISGNTLKPTRMSIHLANHTYQYLMGIVENMLFQLRKFIFLADFIILQMEEDDKVPLILGRPFLH
ncbi:reverse transcriptase domain-containing protein, partial [Tanacetum coccineum]